MVACISIGYFTLSAMWPSSSSDSLSFISLLCHPLLPDTESAYMYINWCMDKENVVSTDTIEYYCHKEEWHYAVIRKTENRLGIITLSETSQTEKDKCHTFSYVIISTF
jgi:hypothetical protein